MHRWKIQDKSFAELESTAIFSMAKEYRLHSIEIVQSQPWKNIAKALKSLADCFWKLRLDHRPLVSEATRVALGMVPYFFVGLSIFVCVWFRGALSPWTILMAFVVGTLDAFVLVIYIFFPDSSYELRIIRCLFIVLRWGLWIMLLVGLLFLYGPLVFGQNRSFGFFVIAGVLLSAVCLLCHILQPGEAWLIPSAVLGIRELQRSRVTFFTVTSVALLSVGVWLSINDWNPWYRGAGFVLSVFAAQVVANMASTRGECGLVVNRVKESIFDVCVLISHERGDVVSLEQAFLRLDAALGADVLNRIPGEAPVCSDEFRYIVSRCGLALVHPGYQEKACELSRLVERRRNALVDSYSAKPARHRSLEQRIDELDERIGHMSPLERRDALARFLSALLGMVSV